MLPHESSETTATTTVKHPNFASLNPTRCSYNGWINLPALAMPDCLSGKVKTFSQPPLNQVSPIIRIPDGRMNVKHPIIENTTFAVECITSSCKCFSKQHRNRISIPPESGDVSHFNHTAPAIALTFAHTQDG